MNINYQFTPIPTNLIYVLDSDCFKLFSFLIQKETYWFNKNKLDVDGYFYLTIEDISNILNMSDRKDVRCVIEALYSNNLIDVKCIKVKGRNSPNKFKINWNKVLEYDEYSMFDINEFNISIKKLNRNSTITYDNSTQIAFNNVNNSKQNPTQNASNNIEDSKQIATTTIYNIDTIDNIYNKEYINNIYNNYILYKTIIERNKYIEGLNDNELYEFIKYCISEKKLKNEITNIIDKNKNRLLNGRFREVKSKLQWY